MQCEQRMQQGRMWCMRVSQVVSKKQAKKVVKPKLARRFHQNASNSLNSVNVCASFEIDSVNLNKYKYHSKKYIFIICALQHLVIRKFKKIRLNTIITQHVTIKQNTHHTQNHNKSIDVFIILIQFINAMMMDTLYRSIVLLLPFPYFYYSLLYSLPFQLKGEQYAFT